MAQLCLSYVSSLWVDSLCLMCCFPSQAHILARYKPRLNTTSLIWQLKQADEYTRDALQNLNNTRHITVYYEDIVRNRTVSSYWFIVNIFCFLPLCCLQALHCCRSFLMSWISSKCRGGIWWAGTWRYTQSHCRSKLRTGAKSTVLSTVPSTRVSWMPLTT